MMRAGAAVRIWPKPLDSRAMFGGPKFAWLRALNTSQRNWIPPALTGREVLGQREVERRHAGSAHDADSRGPEGLRGAEGRERVRVEPSGDRPLRFGQLGIADEVGPGPALAADVEHRRATERRGQAEPALDGVDAGQLPAAEQRIGHRRPVVAEVAALAERQLPDVARHETVLDVELGEAALSLEVGAVLRLQEHAGVESGATPARRDVIRRLGQRLPPGVADERAEPAREPLLEPGLERVVAGVDAVLHPLDVAEARIRPRASRLGAVRVRDDRRLVEVAGPAQLRPLVADIGKVEEQVGHQLVLDAEVVLLDVRGALVRILRSGAPPSSTATMGSRSPDG